MRKIARNRRTPETAGAVPCMQQGDWPRQCSAEFAQRGPFSNPLSVQGTEYKGGVDRMMHAQQQQC